MNTIKERVYSETKKLAEDLGHTFLLKTTYCNERTSKSNTPCKGCDSQTMCVFAVEKIEDMSKIALLEKTLEVTNAQVERILEKLKNPKH